MLASLVVSMDFIRKLSAKATSSHATVVGGVTDLLERLLHNWPLHFCVDEQMLLQVIFSFESFITGATHIITGCRKGRRFCYVMLDIELNHSDDLLLFSSINALNPEDH